MNAIFADTFYYLALLNPKDEAHAKAKAFSSTLRGAVLTTWWVLMEVGDALSRGEERRGQFLSLLADLRSDPQTKIVPGEAVLNEGLALFHERLDKDWSLTDCTSFALMSEVGIRDALTGDHHFEQAGFRALLK